MINLSILHRYQIVLYFFLFYFFVSHIQTIQTTHTTDENRYFGIIKKNDFFEMSEMIQKNLTDCMMARNR